MGLLIQQTLIKQKPEEIASAICELLFNQNKAKQMGFAGEKKVESKFTWQQLASKTEQIYEKVINNNNLLSC